MPLEDVLLRPTGTLTAGESGGREQQHETRVPAVVVEGASELLDACDRLDPPRPTRRSVTAAPRSDHEHADREDGHDHAHGCTQSRPRQRCNRSATPIAS
jgi:hypothetical protein